MKWNEAPFEDIVSESAFGPRFSSECYDPNGNIATLRTTDISNDGVISTCTMPLARIDADKFRSHFLKPGDLVISRSGRIGTTALFTGHHIPVLPGAFLIRFRLRKEQANPLFYKHYFNSKDGQQKLLSVAQGVAQQNINITNVKKITIPIPPIKEQDAIAKIISSYENLINTNQRRITLLEEAARLIYREWFVHNRPPRHDATETKSKIPETPNKIPISEIADFINGFAFKPEHQNPIGLPIVKIPELRDGISEKTPRNPGTNIPTKNHITTGDIIFSWSATLLVNEWAYGPALLNQHLFKVIPKKSSHKRFIRFSIEHAIPFLLGNSVGTTMQHIRRSSLDKYLINPPNDKIINKFASLVDPMIDLSLSLQTVNRQLATARDLLLPKLMSGQIDVSNIQLPDEDVVT